MSKFGPSRSELKLRVAMSAVILSLLASVLVMKGLPKDAHPMAVLRTVVSALAHYDEDSEDVADKGLDKQYGAWPLKRAFQKYIEDALAEEIVNSKLEEGDSIFMDLDKKKEELTIKIEKPEKSPKTE